LAEKIRIAWIEDDIDVIFPVVEPLVNLGAEIEDYENYARAVRNIDRVVECDLILLDINLPPGNLSDAELAERRPGEKFWGVTLLRRLRQEFDYQKPILVFSIIAAAVSVEEMLEKAHADPRNTRVIPKPFSSEDLKNAVLAMLPPAD
jgi:CheY-like chemotaxis protein